MPRTIKVDLFTDTVCPWCLVGSERLDQAIAALPPDVTVEVENHPFYLNPNTPEEGVVVADMLREKYGRDPKEMWARVEGEAKASGIDLDLSQQPLSFLFKYQGLFCKQCIGSFHDVIINYFQFRVRFQRGLNGRFFSFFKQQPGVRAYSCIIIGVLRRRLCRRF